MKNAEWTTIYKPSEFLLLRVGRGLRCNSACCFFYNNNNIDIIYYSIGRCDRRRRLRGCLHQRDGVVVVDRGVSLELKIKFNDKVKHDYNRYVYVYIEGQKIITEKIQMNSQCRFGYPFTIQRSSMFCSTQHPAREKEQREWRRSWAPQPSQQERRLVTGWKRNVVDFWPRPMHITTTLFIPSSSHPGQARPGHSSVSRTCAHFLRGDRSSVRNEINDRGDQYCTVIETKHTLTERKRSFKIYKFAKVMSDEWVCC